MGHCHLIGNKQGLLTPTSHAKRLDKARIGRRIRRETRKKVGIASWGGVDQAGKQEERYFHGVVNGCAVGVLWDKASRKEKRRGAGEGAPP